MIIGFDTATADTAVAAVRDGEARAEILIGPGPHGRPAHGRSLLGAIEEAVTAGGGWEEVERIAVGLGPGSFTGLRIGVSTARALGQARGIDAVGVLSTAALAAGLGELPEAAGRPLLPMIDARRGEVFAALGARGAEATPRVCPPGEIERAFAPEPIRGALAAGDGSVRFRVEIEAAGVEVLSDSNPAHRISARHICTLGAALAPEAEGPKPHYLRRPDAERWHERDNRN